MDRGLYMKQSVSTDDNNIGIEQTRGEPCNYEHLSDDEIKSIDTFCNTVHSLINDKPISGNEEHIIQFWSYLSNNLRTRKGEYALLQTELERQKRDLEHFSLSEDVNSDEYKDILKEIGLILKRRRDTKDIAAYMSVACENIGKIAGFIKGMSNRQYTPRSVKYGGSDASSEQTTVKIDDIKAINQNKNGI